jgi:hypothetical protein
MNAMRSRCFASAAVRVLGTLCAIALATPGSIAGAAEPAEKCESQKLGGTGQYAACRLKAEAKAVLRGIAPDYTKCEENLAKKFGTSEERAGPGVCPSEGDQAVIGAAVAQCTADLALLLAGPEGCPPAYQDRSPHEVVVALRAALAAEDWAAVACHYHGNAFVIDDQGILVGRTEIASAYMSLHGLFGGAQPVVNDEIVHQDTVRTLFTLDGGWIVIPDGVHTYRILAGRIQLQTTHGLIEFTGPPPEQ